MFVKNFKGHFYHCEKNKLKGGGRRRGRVAKEKAMMVLCELKRLAQPISLVVEIE